MESCRSEEGEIPSRGDSVLDAVEEWLSAWKTDYTWNKNDFDIEFNLALKDLCVDSSVGVCDMAYYGNDVKTALGWDTVSFDPERVEVLRNLVLGRMENPHLFDPIRVFVKQEPHKLTKLQEGRLRLISAVSLVDTMVDRVIFGRLVRRVVSTVGSNPIMIGWSPVATGGSSYPRVVFGGKPVRALDKTAWDWTVRGDLLLRLKKLLKRLMLFLPSDLDELIDRRWEALFRDALFCFGDRVQWRQPGWGVMKSGCYLTILLNSVGQLLLHVQACMNLGLSWRVKCMVMGDDMTVEDFEGFEDYLMEIRRMGYLVKDSLPSDVVEFCGFQFIGYAAIPTYWRKHVYTIAHQAPQVLVETLDSYQLNYAFDPVFLRWVQICLAKLSPSKVKRVELLRAQFLGLV